MTHPDPIKALVGLEAELVLELKHINQYSPPFKKGDGPQIDRKTLQTILAAIEALTPIASGSGVVPVGPIEVGDVMPTNMREILDEQLARAKREGRTLPDPASTGKDKEPT